MSRPHAILGPSSASKWLTCAPSARLEQQFADIENDAAKEGTLAHSLGELIISQRRNAITNKRFREQLEILESNEFYNKAMYEYADGYAVYVLEQLSAAMAITPDAKLFIEQQLDLSAYIREGFGTGDAGIVSDIVLDITDLKYGKGVRVSAIDNSQLKIYALGWLEEFGYLYNIQTIRMTIYQPRMNNISVFEMSYADLMSWADTVLKPRAEIAFKGDGEFMAGRHCQFCKAKTTCKANAEYQVQIAQMDFKDIDKTAILSTDPALLRDDEIANILNRADAFKNWVNAVEDYALAQALAGKKWPGFKLVNGRSVRKFTDPKAVEKLLVKEGFDRTKIFKAQEMIGITEMEKLTGKKLFDLKISPFTIKAPGAPALVDKDDKRSEYNSAANDFVAIEDDLSGKTIFHNNLKRQIMSESPSTKVLIKNVRFSYFNGWHPTAMKDSDKKKYNTVLLIAKDNPAMPEIRAVLKALEDAAKAENNGVLPGTKKQPWHNPLNDGDVDKPDNDEYAGMFFLNAKSDTKPGIVSTEKDAEGKFKPITDESQVYSGCYGHVTINFFRFGKKGDVNNGIGVGLNNIMKTRDGEALAGKSSANTDFADVVLDDDFGGDSNDDDLG